MDKIYITFAFLIIVKSFSAESLVVSLDKTTFDAFKNGPGVKLVFFQKNSEDKGW